MNGLSTQTRRIQMPAPHDLDPDAMTDMERRQKRMYEAGFAFETQPRTEHFDQGASEGRGQPKFVTVKD
jgi:hypothetical protein